MFLSIYKRITWYPQGAKVQMFNCRIWESQNFYLKSLFLIKKKGESGSEEWFFYDFSYEKKMLSIINTCSQNFDAENKNLKREEEEEVLMCAAFEIFFLFNHCCVKTSKFWNLYMKAKINLLP